MYSRSVVNAIMTNWISLYGAPATIRMDQGKEFDNALLKNLLNALNVNIKIGFSHNHQSNPVERFHRTLWALLKAKKANGENDWEKSLPTLILAYNLTQHFSTNSSPARIFLGRELNIPHLSLLPKFVKNNNPSPHSMEEELDYILDLMRASDNVRIRRQFRSYEGLVEDIQVGDRVYCAALPPQGNTRKLQLRWSGPVLVQKIINDAMLELREYDVRNPRTYVAHRSKVRVAKKFGQKDLDPLFKLPRIEAGALADLAEELSSFELPAKQLDATLVDEFYSQNSTIHHRGRSHCSSISSTPPASPQTSSESTSSSSSDNRFQSFIQSPGSTRSSKSNPQEQFEEHFQVEDEALNETIGDPPSEQNEIMGSAANLTPEIEPEPEKTAGTSGGGEILTGINTPPPQNQQITESKDDEEDNRPLDGSTTTDTTRRRSSRKSILPERYSAEFKLPKKPKSKRSSIAPSLKSLKTALKESWAQRPDTTAPLRRRSRSRESSDSTRTRAASLERIQTGSIEKSGSIRSSVRTRYKVVNQSSYVQGAEESSWSDTEDEADNSSNGVRKGINAISGQKSSIAKVKNSVTLHPGQGTWVYLIEEPGQVSGNDFVFPILFNTIIERNLFASKFSPRAGVLRSPAIYLINHNNAIFVQVKKGESLGKLVSLMVRSQTGQSSTRGKGTRE